jgi:hypothetical protein
MLLYVLLAVKLVSRFDRRVEGALRRKPSAVIYCRAIRAASFPENRATGVGGDWELKAAGVGLAQGLAPNGGVDLLPRRDHLILQLCGPLGSNRGGVS